MIQTDTWRWNNLPNFGFITEKVPGNLFDKIKQECELARQSRYDLVETKKQQMVSDLTSSGIPKHYYLEDCREELSAFVLKMYDLYESNYNYLSRCRINNCDAGVTATPPWVNIQERGEYIPLHHHESILSYVIWVKIPYDINKENINGVGSASKFYFTYNSTVGGLMNYSIPVSKDYEGTIMMFPSTLHHQVYPFYTSDDVRISVSGMVSIDVSNPMPSEQQIEMFPELKNITKKV